MKTDFAISVESTGRMRKRHVISVDDAAEVYYSGEVRVDNVSGEAIHVGHFSTTMETLVVLNSGAVAFKLQFNSTSTPIGSANEVTLNPGDVFIADNAKNGSDETVKLFAINSGDEGVAEFWVSGTN